jgi:hypothetical protein
MNHTTGSEGSESLIYFDYHLSLEGQKLLSRLKLLTLMLGVLPSGIFADDRWMGASGAYRRNGDDAGGRA